MARGDSIARQLELMEILQSRGQLAVAEVARELGYTTRTLYRDLLVLERVGVPIYQERRGRRSRWRVADGYRRRLNVTLTWSEALALAAGRAMLAASSSSPFEQAADAALQKIRSCLPAELLARAQKAQGRVSAVSGPVHDYAERSEELRRVIEALERQETIEVDYRKPGGRTERRHLDPYHLHLQAGALYLFAWDHERRGVRTFLADRLLVVRGTGRSFAPDGAFLAGGVLQGAFGPWAGKPVRVELRFDRRAAPYVAEERMHPSQTNQWREGGALDVRLRVPIGPRLVSWILGWGAQVHVLAPRRLAERVRKEHALATRSKA